MKNSIEPRGWKTPEFLLVVVMLLILTFLVCAVLWLPISLNGSNKATAKDILDFRRTILSIIITAFGAWVGAGAAYYFGRETQRESARSLLKMRDLSGRELLRQTPISKIPPRKIQWTVKTSDDLGPVMTKLREDPDLWFITIVKDDGTLETVIHEEAIWRFVDAQVIAKTPYDDIEKTKMSAVLAFIKETKKLADRIGKIYVPVTPDNTAEMADVLMQSKKVFLAVICDESGKPTHFITTGDLRVLLVQAG
ncbi:MAG: hypothetical protein KJ621_01160 [Proteobacteria bacterium]|nr:hypothetical protein [Pseudomonadota bacterium]